MQALLQSFWARRTQRPRSMFLTAQAPDLWSISRHACSANVYHRCSQSYYPSRCALHQRHASTPRYSPECPSASLNRWIVAILAFHFTLVHVPCIAHGPDGLSRRKPQPGDEVATSNDDDFDFENWIDRLYSFVHQKNPIHPHIPLSTISHSHSLPHVSVFAGSCASDARQDFSWEETCLAEEVPQEQLNTNEALSVDDPSNDDYVAIP